MEECRDTKVFQLLAAHPQLAAERDGSLGDAETGSGVVALAGLEMKGHQLEHRDVRALEVLESRAPLIGQRADHIAGEDEETRPGNHREEMPRADPSLDGSGAVQPDEGLEEGNENDDEDRRPDSTPPAQIEAGGNDGQIVEVEKRDLLVDEPVDGEHRPNEQQHENELEVLEDEPPGTIESRLTDDRALMRDTHHMRDAQERGIATWLVAGSW